MSLEARQALVDSPFTIFQAESQRTDLLDPAMTQTGLIALLGGLVAKQYFILFTAIRSDHHDDSALGLHCHANGYCADCWVNNSASAQDYADAMAPRFEIFLESAAASPWIFQIGLAGSAWTPTNVAAAGETCFEDDGGDHIHLGATNTMGV